MKQLKKCFGIPSWLPNTEPGRSQRKNRLTKLVAQLSTLWPGIDFLFIAQNWGDFKPHSDTNKIIIKYYEPLGILKARHTLREEFLRLNYDYIIMFDDDAIIEYTNKEVLDQYMVALDAHPNGFCFMPGKNSKYHPYVAAQLNLCAISKFIYAMEPMVDIDPQKDEGYEDSIFACLLHNKYKSYEFLPPQGIKCIQWENSQYRITSTWAEVPHAYAIMQANTNAIQEWITQYKEFPVHYKKIIEDNNYKPPEKQADGRKNCFLYF